MNLSPLVNQLIVIGGAGVAVALNLLIVGLILIAVVHDGTTASQVASLFQQVLLQAITALSTLVGMIAGGKAVHNAYMAKQGSGN